MSFRTGARSEFGPGPDLIWVRDPYRFRPSANPISTLRVISFSKCRDATNHSNCRKKKLKKKVKKKEKKKMKKKKIKNKIKNKKRKSKKKS